MKRQKKYLEKKHKDDIQMQADAYEEQTELLENENQKIKNQNLYLETHMHDQRLD